MPCSRPQSTRQEEEGRGAEVGRIVSASEEEEGREAKIREKIQPRYRWPAVSSLKGCRCTFCEVGREFAVDCPREIHANTRSDKGGISFLRDAYVPTGTGKDTRGGGLFFFFSSLFFSFSSPFLLLFLGLEREEKEKKRKRKAKKRRKKRPPPPAPRVSLPVPVGT